MWLQDKGIKWPTLTLNYFYGTIRLIGLTFQINTIILQLYVIEKSEYIIWVLPIGKGGRGTLPKRGGGVKSYVGNALYWKHQLGKVRNKDLNKDFPKKN